MTEKGLEHYTSKNKAPWLHFDYSPQLIYSQPNKRWLINLKLEDQGQKKGLNKKNIDLRMFCEKLPLRFTIFSKSYVFP